MSQQDIPDDFLALIKKITNKRAKIVLLHLLKHGHITTEELEKDYGYKHPPRAARDVREAGIPLISFKVKSRNGDKLIGAYKFGDFKNIRRDRLQGRVSWPKKFKIKLLERYGSQCVISGAKLALRALQIDHRIPYEVIGDVRDNAELDVEDFMLLSGSSNRAKSWSCEHCQNWIDERNPDICRTCYWAFPENYIHIAMRKIRRLDLTWQEEEVVDYETLKHLAQSEGLTVAEYVKKIIRENK